MRLMNFDVPHIQDLASARRYPHSIGTCYLAYKLAEASSLPLNAKKRLVAAALVHDIGILPFGHLLESIIRKRRPSFSHENLVYAILTGTYHPTNIYHQILESASLRLANVLRHQNIEVESVYKLICPTTEFGSAISDDVDLDNIDNVHRMAALLGFDNARENMSLLTKNMWVDNNFNLHFSPTAISGVMAWQEMRQKMYTMIIAHPECVAYNAFLSLLLTKAVENGVIETGDIEKTEWFLTDHLFEQRLLQCEATHDLAAWLYTRPQYELIDYVWCVSTEKAPRPFSEVEALIMDAQIDLPRASCFYFFWPESKLISREVKLLLTGHKRCAIGLNSSSILISLITKRDYGKSPVKESGSKKRIWRNSVIELLRHRLPNWNFLYDFPEDYSGDYPCLKTNREQLELF